MSFCLLIFGRHSLISCSLSCCLLEAACFVLSFAECSVSQPTIPVHCGIYPGPGRVHGLWTEPSVSPDLRAHGLPLSKLNPCEASASVQSQDDSCVRQVDLASARCDIFGHMFSFDIANHCHLVPHHPERLPSPLPTEAFCQHHLLPSEH